jgi:hypothetical protein
MRPQVRTREGCHTIRFTRFDSRLTFSCPRRRSNSFSSLRTSTGPLHGQKAALLFLVGRIHCYIAHSQTSTTEAVEAATCDVA